MLMTSELVDNHERGGLNGDAVRDRIAHALRDGARLRYATLHACSEEIARASRLVAEALQRGNKVFLFGNGGSAADAQHIAAELVGRFVVERRPLPGIALTTDTSALTAIGNDYGFDQVFARQLGGLANEGDVAVAITTSGKSTNVLAAIEVARERKMHVIGLTGANGKAFAEVCDACVIVPSTIAARIQEIHITVGHLICEAVDTLLCSNETANGASPAARADRSSWGKVLDLEMLLALRERWRNEGRTVVLMNGVFDVLHVGHLSSLRAARTQGDVLVVGINADESLRGGKGTRTSVYPAAERAEMLAALEDVDYVVVFSEPTLIEVLSKLNPDVHWRGPDV